MARFKTPLIFSLAGLVLSFFIGLISGVQFTTVIIRSLVLAVICGAFVFLVREVLNRFVPELLQSGTSFPEHVPAASGGGVGQTEVPTGQKLNISIDDPIEMDDLPSQDFDEEPSGKSNAAPSDMEDLEEMPAVDSVDESPAATNSGGAVKPLNSVRQSQAAEVATAANTGSGIHDSAEHSDADVGSEKNETGDSSGELDELPDLKEFVSDADDITGNNSVDFTHEGTGRFDVSAELDTMDVDTVTMAKAIKTVLKQES